MSFHTLDCVSVDKFNFSNQSQRHKKLVQTYMFFLFLQYSYSENNAAGIYCRMVFYSVCLFSSSFQFLIPHHQGRCDEGTDAQKSGENEKATIAKGLLKRAGEHHGSHDRHRDQ